MDYTLASFLTILTNTEKQSKTNRRHVSNFHLYEYLRNLGNPQLKYKSIHIAGTKGKGTTATIISHLLHSLGYKVGLYTSPHIKTFLERIQVNNKNVPYSKLNHTFLTHLYPIVKDEATAGRRLTYFELLTLLAIKQFELEQVDFAVFEVGLGGRLDATNIIKPILAIITNVDYDHTEILGRKLNKIAYEKGGIIKPNVCLVTGSNNSTVNSILKQIIIMNNSETFQDCKSAKIIALNKDFFIEKMKIAHRNNSYGVYFNYTDFSVQIKRIFLPLIGFHNAINSSLALASLSYLASKKFISINGKIPTIKKALAEVQIFGRISIYSRKPLIILDVAHNPISIKALVDTLISYFPEKQWIVLFATTKYKNALEMLAELHKLPISSMVLTEHSNPRHLKLASIKNILNKYYSSLQQNKNTSHGKAKKLVFIQNIHSAFKESVKLLLAREQDASTYKMTAKNTAEKALLITGSFYTLSDVLPLLSRHRSQKNLRFNSF